MDEDRKRQRSANYTQDEINLLLNLVTEYKSVVENKANNGVTRREKERAWQEIAKNFAALSRMGIVRSADSLRKAYENKKKNVRSAVANEKLALFKTGGGVDPNVPKDVNEELALGLMAKKSVYGMDCMFGGDSSLLGISGPKLPETITTSSLLGASTGDPCCSSAEQVHDDESLQLTEDGEIGNVNWGDYKIGHLQTPVNKKLKLRAATDWSHRRRPIVNNLHSTDISKKYSELADIKMEVARVQLEMLKEEQASKRAEHEASKIERKLREKLLLLDVALKEEKLKEFKRNT